MFPSKPPAERSAQPQLEIRTAELERRTALLSGIETGYERLQSVRQRARIIQTKFIQGEWLHRTQCTLLWGVAFNVIPTGSQTSEVAAQKVALLIGEIGS
jgi:hypothetical protein